MTISQELLNILVCPACKQPVAEERDQLVCTNQNCGLQYPVRDGIPVMLIEEAKKPVQK